MIGKIPQSIAEFLNLESSHEYTGHCFRRIAARATLLANIGDDMLSIKRFGGWKSQAVVEGYIEESVLSKIQIAQRLTNSQP